MAMITGQQQNFKHHCRICRKGFGCGRALGGHMRAHGINDDAAAAAAAVEPSDAAGSGVGAEEDDPCNRRMYALRGNHNRQRTCRACEHCGKEFFSWKAFLEHGRCVSACEELAGESLVSAVAGEDDDEEDDDDDDDDMEERRECVSWSKGKRSRRSKVAAALPGGLSSQEEDLANCLVMLSAGRVEPPAAALVETEESCASASKEDRRNSREKTAAFLPVEKPKGMFECKACKKVFTSHQALGGHRASHKKVKGCFAAKLDEQEDGQPEEELAAGVAGSGEGDGAMVPYGHAPPQRKKKLHECSVCHRVFTSGQALGGHKRCHWLTSNAGEQSGSMAKLQHTQQQSRTQTHTLLQLRPISEQQLDLNLPAPPDDGGGVRQDMAAPLRLNVPALFLQAWIETDNIDPAATVTPHSMNKKINVSHVEDEADSSVKLAKLSDLKDLNVGGASTSWLQVGLGSSSKETRKP